MTTLALGEEGGSFNPEPPEYVTKGLNETGIELPTMTTMALGEEGGSFNPEPPQYVTKGLNEAGYVIPNLDADIIHTFTNTNLLFIEEYIASKK